LEFSNSFPFFSDESIDSHMRDIPKFLEIAGIEAKRRGGEWVSKCPIHVDNDPSFYIDDDGLWYCFGCTRGGGLGLLVEIMMNLSWQEAKEWLFKNGILQDEPYFLGNVQLEVFEPGSPKKFVAPRGCVFEPILENWPTPIRRYVLERGITHSQVMKWKLGYALHGRLGGRVIFPHFKGNEMVGYSARSFDGREPRYLTPAPNEHPSPSVLFGELHWNDFSCVTVTEGSINALACELAGANSIAAFGGSPMSAVRVDSTKPVTVPSGILAAVMKLSSFRKILIATDPDKAGNEMFDAVRALGRWSEVSRVDIPVGSDAAKMETSNLRQRLLDAGLPS
jgi:DNA primase